jgi:hypothetical protein
MSILTKVDNYQHWRDNKLANATLEPIFIEINNPFSLTQAEKQQLKIHCTHNNFATFSITKQNNYPNSIVAMNQQLGLIDYDNHLYAKNNGLSHITPQTNKAQAEFIPYTHQAIGWHTDGYYNSEENRIRSFSLFCVCPAHSGGENTWIDPQILYLKIREFNADIAQALTHPQAMTIPEHRVNGLVRRPTSIGAIFFIDNLTQSLSMRYTQRKKYIHFLDSNEVKQAIEALDVLLSQEGDYYFKHRLKSGEGLLSNNVIHKRATFSESTNSPRLLLRGRYFKQLNQDD